MNRFLTRFLFPGIITVAAVAGAVVMGRSAESAERETPVTIAPLVEVIEVQAAPAHPRLRGTGTVEPAREATLSPELAGRIVYVSPSLVVGGRVAEGETLLRIDKRDYEIAVRQQRAQVRQAEVDLELEKAFGKVAKQEWELMGNPNGDGRLAVREPQREAAEVKVDSARAALERARLDMGRTAVKAPFNATVVSESVEEGELATKGQVVATLVGTDALWVRVSVPVEYLALLQVPGLGGATEGSPARVVQRLGSRGEVALEGRVIRLVGELDAESRTAQVLVEVEHPLDPPPGELPLLPGAFVEVELTGPEVPGVLAVPRLAVFEGRSSWVVDDEGRLRKRTLEIGWGDDEQVFVTGGLRSGDHVVITPPSPALEGMEVRRADASTPAATVSAAPREPEAAPATPGAKPEPAAAATNDQSSVPKRSVEG
ncbi:MAG: efflux RND transporter periplasmic adaptor subunit [Myxococcales bacterium]|nr:efflux RND transporter periplasmic adaptor subunit [Myxococcales bacterium]MCB9716944.1 efflux RND transporter periplasmic adaptor subunit [Myxococcales bacterium]